MDAHSLRVCGPLMRSWQAFHAGETTLIDLARVSEQVANALDNASAPLPLLLMTAAADLESAYHTNLPENHYSLGLRILGPAISAIETSPEHRS